MLAAFAVALALQAEPKTYLKDITDLMAKAWPNNRMIQIVCHGHSVPAGYFKTPTVDTFNAYPHLLHVELKKRFPLAVINVTVTAIGGENSISGAKRFAEDVLTRKPDVVTIDYGLNDRGFKASDVKQAWQSMIDQAKAKGIKVLLMTPTPDQSANMTNPDDPLNQQVAQIKQLAKENEIGLVDSYGAFQSEIAKGVKLPALMAQVNHPNRAGHDLVVRELLKWFP